MTDLDALDRGDLERLIGQAVAALVRKAIPPTEPGERLLDPGQAAERLSLTRQRVLELHRQGLLSGRKVGRHVLIREASVSEFARSTLSAPGAPRGRVPAPERPLAAARRRLRGVLR
jgi:excisionase family DNA binding protein